MTMENVWGDGDSHVNATNLGHRILSWFISGQNGELFIDDLENHLDESMVSLFRMEVDDGSVEEVAVALMTLYEQTAP